MRLDPGFLSLPVETGELDSSFSEAKLTVSNLVVGNDVAERGVKLCHDYINSRKQKGVLQNILQLVENIRARIPDLRQREKQRKTSGFLCSNNLLYCRYMHSSFFKSVNLTTAV